MPGTHSRWVVAEQRRIRRFHAVMTGEVFAVLRGHTRVGWFPEGTDAWLAEGEDLVPAMPP